MADESIPSEFTTYVTDDVTSPHLSEEVPCPYLPQRKSRSEAYRADHLDPVMHQHLLSHGFRRSGRVVYRPRCRNCQECRSLRIPVQRFELSRSQRRVMRRNSDVSVRLGTAEATEERFDLYLRYLDVQHDHTMSRNFDTFAEFLYNSPTPGAEFQYRLGDRLIGVSVIDRVADGMSSVYMYFDPEEAKRSLGTYSILREIHYCQTNHMPYYYLGYHVAGSKTMSYKSHFRPYELLVGDERWLTIPK